MFTRTRIAALVATSVLALSATTALAPAASAAVLDKDNYVQMTVTNNAQSSKPISVDGAVIKPGNTVTVKVPLSRYTGSITSTQKYQCDYTAKVSQVLRVNGKTQNFTRQGKSADVYTHSNASTPKSQKVNITNYDCWKPVKSTLTLSNDRITSTEVLRLNGRQVSVYGNSSTDFGNPHGNRLVAVQTKDSCLVKFTDGNGKSFTTKKPAKVTTYKAKYSTNYTVKVVSCKK